ncbi:MAG: mechanosensitive ion channel [Deltaproteobacteria bacterium]|nr:mechanosensitive ion channel [Deltaproteobacteria bacterium]
MDAAIAVPEGLGFFDIVRVTGLPFAVLALVVAWIAARIVSKVFVRLGDRFTDRRLLLNQVSTVLRFLVYLVGIVAAVSFAMRLTDEVVLALTGTVAITVGFAVKDLAASIVAGVIILVDRPFQVGDRVTFGGVYGEISSIGLRSVRLVTLDDNVVTIPNNKFLTDMVSSGNWGALDMLVQMDFHVGIDQDLALARRLVGEALTGSRYVFLEKPWEVLVSQILEDGYFAWRLRAKAYVLDVRFEKVFETDVSERVCEAFRHAGIGPPARLNRMLPPVLEGTERE